MENDQANRAIDETAEKAEGAGKRTESAFDGIGRAALGVGKFVLGAGAALGGAWLAAIEGTREYRAEMGLLDSAFQASGHSSTEARNTYSQLNAVMGDTEAAVEAAQHIALIADNEREMNELTEIGTGVFAKFGQSLPLEGLMEGIGHTSQLGEVQGSLADALEWSGITVEDFNEQLALCSDEEERQDLIMRTLKDTYGAAAEQYKATNKDVMNARMAQERLTNAMAELGRVGEPILTVIKNGIATMVSSAVPKLESLIQKVQDARKWMQQNKNTVDAWKAAIVGAATSAGLFITILKWGSIMSAAKTAVLGVRGAVLLLNAAMKANIIGLVISLVIGLGAAFVTLWRNNEAFRNFWIGLWERIKSTCGAAVNWIRGRFGSLSGAADAVRNTFNRIQNSISDRMSAARNAVKNAIDRIKGFFKFNWSLPKLKMPTFTMNGKFSLNPPSVPKLGVKWNAEGGILTKPTLFGQIGDTVLGGGEAGHEAILPIDRLEVYVRNAVRAENELTGRIIIDQTERLIDALERLIPRDVTLDKAVLVGALLPAVDTGLNDRYLHARRGNVR